MRTLLKISLAAAALSATVVANAETAYGVTLDNQLVTFDTATPSTIVSSLFLDGLNGNNVAGIDFRPATGQLYVLDTSSRLFTANLTTGSLTQVGSRFSTLLNGANFGVDFNPTVDRLRITSDTRQNLRVNPTDATVTVDGQITIAGSANPQITSVAYSNNFQGATTTTMYGVDASTNSLVSFSNPNAGTGSIIGALGFDAAGLTGFDISGTTGIAYASVQPAGVSGSSLYTINLATGQATLVGALGSQGAINQFRGLTIAPAPVPEPASIAAIGIGLVAMARRRKAKKA